MSDFLESVTGLRGQGKYRAKSIKHLIIRCIQRALSLIIYTRNENMDKVTIKDMELLDLMLDPRGELERPDLMLHMVCHWEKVREETKEDGTVRAATYPMALAYMLILDVLRYLMIPYTPHFDMNYLIGCGFVCKVPSKKPQEPDVYLWKQEHSFDMHLLIRAPISFGRKET
jgi:hypothetical protein